MPISESTASLIGAGVSAAGTAASITMGGKMNQKAVRQAIKTRQWQTAEREASQQWQLEQWNRENEYNSPEAQKARLLAAGYSPLALLNNGDLGSAAAVSAPSDPSASIPHLENPMSGSGIESVSQKFLDWKKLELQSKAVDAQSRAVDADVDYKFELAKTERESRDGRITYLGVQIDLGKEMIGRTKEETRLFAQKVVNSQTEVQQMLQFMKESNARTSLYDWERYASKIMLPKQLKLLGSQILANENLATLHHWQARTEHDLLQSRTDYSNQAAYQMRLNSDQAYEYNSKYMKNDLANRFIQGREATKQSQYLTRQIKGMTYSDKGYAILRGLNLTSQSIGAFTDALKGFMYQQIGNRGLNHMPQSAPNPTPLQPNMPGIGY